MQANAIASKPNAPWRSAGGAIGRPASGTTVALTASIAAAPISVGLLINAYRASSTRTSNDRERACTFGYLFGAYLMPVRATMA